MSLGRKLIDILMAGSRPFRREGASSSHTVIVKHSSTKIMTSDGTDVTFDDGMLAEMATALGLQEAELRQLLEQGSAESIADLLQKHAGTASVEVRKTVSPALRVECHDCHRTVARGDGYCMYCGAYLPLEEKATSTTKSVQQQVDEQFVKDSEAAQPQKEMTQEEQQAFLRRISHM